MQFLLTHPVWDVTVCLKITIEGDNISTHTSRVGCDPEPQADKTAIKISTHTSRVGCDDVVVREEEQCRDFYSHIPCGM